MSIKDWPEDKVIAYVQYDQQVVKETYGVRKTLGARARRKAKREYERRMREWVESHREWPQSPGKPPGKP